MDDLPVGKGQASSGFGSEFPSEQPPAQAAANADDDKPLEERLVSKVWNVRAKAFEDLKAIIAKFEEGCSNEVMDKHSQLWSKYLAEANAGALEKVLDCFEEYIKKCDQGILKSIQIPVLTPIIEKCLGQARPSIKTKSLECALLLFEVAEEFGEEVQDVLLKYCKDKRPKVFQIAIALLAQLMQAYGIKKFSPAKYQAQIEVAANSPTPAVRAEAMNCYKAIFLWVGEAGVGPIIDGLKQAQKDTLKKDFEALKDKKDFKRKTRSEQAAAKEAAIDALMNEETKEEEEEKVDAFDISAPKEILKDFGPDWITETLAMKKWDQKRDRLILVQEAASAPKLANENYTALFEALKKMAGENHAVVAQNAIKAIGLLANGLRSAFHDMGLQAVPVLFAKFKEKRIVEDIYTAMEQIMMAITLDEILEIIKEALKKEKAPIGKTAMMVFMEKAIRTTYIDALTDMKDQLIPIPMSLIDDKDPGLREQALTVIGICVGRLGDSAMAKHTEGMIAAKMTKVTQAKETVKLSKYDKSERKAAEAKKKADAAAAKKKPPSATKPTASAAAAAAGAGGTADEEMNFMDAPKKPIAKKPALGARKPKPAATEDDKVADKPKVGGPPARLGGASAAASAPKSTGPAKIIKASDIKEEEVGAGMSKEDALAKVAEFYDAGHVAKFEEAKWQTKVEGFTGLKQQIEELKPDSRTVEATTKFIKAKLKDWKESNINLMKEAVFTFQSMVANCENISKRAVLVYAPFLGEKIGDIKMSPAIKALYMDLGEFVTAKFISIQVIKHGLTTKAPNNIKEAANFMSAQIDEYGISRVAIKETVDFAIFCVSHANKAIRDAGMALFAVIYKHLGEGCRSFMSDIKPSTQQLIDAEFEKVTPYKKGEFKSERVVKGEALQEVSAKGGAAAAEEVDPLKALSDAMPREDISKQLNTRLIKLFTEGDWKNKVKGCEEVMNILNAAKMRIKVDGINELMDVLTKCFKESNKAVLKQAILLTGAMGEAVGEPILRFAKKCLVPMLNFLGDKAALMRADVIASADKWGEAIGRHYIINYLCTYFVDGNPQMREDGLKWMTAHKDEIKKADHQAMVKPLIACLSDKKAEIRTMALEIIVEVICLIGFAPFQTGIQSLKPAIQQTVRPLLEKAKTKAAQQNPDAAMEVDDAPTSAAAKSKTATTRSTVPKKPTGPTLKPSVQAQIDAAKAAEDSVSSKGNSFAAAANSKRPQTSRATVGARPSKSLAAAKEEEEEFVCNPGNKERRALADSKNKWMHEELNKNQVEAVKKYCEDIFGFDSTKVMFGSDFKKHVGFIQKFIGMIESQPENLQEIVDIIFKWIYIKMTESSNTTFALNVYDFLNTMFTFLIEQQYILWDHEAHVIVPMLCNQSGVNNKTLQAKIKGLIKQCFELHDHRKTLMLIIKYGCTNKNLKSVAESLDEIAVYLAKNGLDSINEAQVKVISKHCESSDAGVREKALQVLSEIYKVLDEDIWSIVGNVSIKVKGLLEQRFKKLKSLGSSKSNMNLTVQNRVPKATTAASPSKSSSNLNRSFNPKNNTTTPRSGLKFTGIGKQDSSSKQSSGLQKSFRPGTASQSKLNSSFKAGERSLGARLKTPSTAKAQQDVGRATEKNDGSNQRFTEIPNFHPDAQHDSDEDLTAENPSSASASKPEEILDPETQQQVSDIIKHINNLKYSTELSKRVESLIALNDIIQAVDKYEKGIQRTANDLISSFTHELKDIFDRPKEEMPLRFAKYFVTIVNKTCSCKKIMELVKEQELYELGEQLLKRLLIDNLDKLGDDKEGEFILKNLNGSMLRCLENCNKTSIFCVLFNLLRRYKHSPEYSKLPGLIIKCLLKLSKILEKVINDLEDERILIVIHLYMISIDHEKKTSNDEMGIRIVKTLVHEMVKVKQHKVMDAYKIVAQHEVEDKHLIRWIKIILNSFGDPPPSSSQSNSQSGVSQNPEQEIGQIIEEMKNNEESVSKLHNFLNRNPHLNLDYYLRHLEDSHALNVKHNLTQYKNSLSDSGSTPVAQNNNWVDQTDVQPQDKPNFTRAAQTTTNQGSEQKRFGFKSSAAQATNQQSSGLNPTSGGSSFRANQSSSGLRPMTATNAGSTGASKNESSLGGNNPQEQTSKDRMTSYANKLSQMRDKFQQRKSVTGADPKGLTAAQGATQPSSASAKKNLNTSFSAMNNSLQAKWKAVSKPQAAQKEPGAQLSNTMIGAGTGFNSRMTIQANSSGQEGEPSGSEQLTRSQNAALANRLSQNNAGASNTDLNRKLQEMKAKLAALKK